MRLRNRNLNPLLGMTVLSTCHRRFRSYGLSMDLNPLLGMSALLTNAAGTLSAGNTIFKSPPRDVCLFNSVVGIVAGVVDLI